MLRAVILSCCVLTTLVAQGLSIQCISGVGNNPNEWVNAQCAYGCYYGENDRGCADRARDEECLIQPDLTYRCYCSKVLCNSLILKQVSCYSGFGDDSSKWAITQCPNTCHYESRTVGNQTTSLRSCGTPTDKLGWSVSSDRLTYNCDENKCNGESIEKPPVFSCYMGSGDDVAQLTISGPICAACTTTGRGSSARRNCIPLAGNTVMYAGCDSNSGQCICLGDKCNAPVDINNYLVGLTCYSGYGFADGGHNNLLRTTRNCIACQRREIYHKEYDARTVDMSCSVLNPDLEDAEGGALGCYKINANDDGSIVVKVCTCRDHDQCNNAGLATYSVTLLSLAALLAFFF